MSDFKCELKVCEACGALWLRANQHGVYCRGCESRLSEFPAPRSGRRCRSGSRTPQRTVRQPGMAPVLPQVYAVAVVYAQQPKADPVVWGPRNIVDPEPASRPKVAMVFYRRYTEAMLRRYMRMSMECGRTPALLGRELFRGNVSNVRVGDFGDQIAFCLDVEKCMGRVSEMGRQVIRRIGLQEYTQAEAAAVLGMSLRTVARRYGEALDALTGMFLETRMLEPLKGCM